MFEGGLNSTSTYVPAQLTKDKLLHHSNALTKINVKIDKYEQPTFYWLPKLHKHPFKSRFISNSSHCCTTFLSKHITSALTTVKNHVIKYNEYEERLLLKCIHYFDWELINNMDHMRISGTEPSSVILSQTK